MSWPVSEIQETYQKDFSLIEVRQRSLNREDATSRIARLRERIRDKVDSGRRLDILRQACDDVLGLNLPSAVEPRFYLRDFVLAEIERIGNDDLPRYLFYRYRYEIFPKRKTVDHFPPCLQIEPSSICNYRCVFCYQTDPHFTQRDGEDMGFIKLDLFKRIVDQAEGNCEAVTLSSRGEPLMNPEIERMLNHVRGKFLALKLNTNA